MNEELTMQVEQILKDAFEDFGCDIKWGVIKRTRFCKARLRVGNKNAVEIIFSNDEGKLVIWSDSYGDWKPATPQNVACVAMLKMAGVE